MASSTFLELLKSKKNFFFLVYSALIFQLLVTITIVYEFRKHPILSQMYERAFWVYVIGIIICLLLILFIKMPRWVKILVCLVMTAFIGALLHSLSFYLSQEVVSRALLGSLSIFISMTVLALIILFFQYDISWIGIYLVAILIALIISSLLVYNESVPYIVSRFFIIIGLIIFSIMIVFNTNVMMSKGFTGDFIDASLDFYLSIVNIFIRLLYLKA